MNRRLVARAAAVLVLGLTIGAAVVAANADGRSGVGVSTNDGGAWIANQYEGALGHVNRATLEVTTAVAPVSPLSAVDVTQARESVVLHDADTNRMLVIDDRNTRVARHLDLPAGARPVAFDQGVAVVSPIDGGLWVMSRAESREVRSLAEVEPLLAPDESVTTGTPRLYAAVGIDGDLVVLDQQSGLVHRVASGTASPTVVGLDHPDLPQIDRVGIVGVSVSGAEVAVVSRRGVAFLGAGEPVWAPHLVGEGAVVEAPGSDGDGVVILDEGRLVRVGADGTVTEVGEVGGDHHLPPIAHDGCVYAVSEEPPVLHRVCDGSTLERPVSGEPGSLRLRLVNGWIWVNDLASGQAWIVEPDGTLGAVTGWGAALGYFDEETRDGTSDGDTETEQFEDRDNTIAEVVGQRELDTGPNEPPEAKDDEAFTRRDRPVMVPVVANDIDLNGDVMMIDSVDEIDGAVGQLEVSADRQSIQFRPAAGFPADGEDGSAWFTYRIDDGRGGRAEARVDVEVVGGDENTPPTPEIDIAATRSGEATSVDVLANDTDPEGDSLVVTAVEPSQGTARFTPSGTVTYLPVPGTEEGRAEVRYTVRDDFGEEAEGRLVVAIRPSTSNNEPTARNDAAVGVVGVPMSLNILHNDTDPDGDPLTVVSPLDDPQVFLTADGHLTYVPAEPVTKVIRYLITDGYETVGAQVRLEATESALNRPPVAIRDDAFVGDGASVIVDALSNDSDPDGDVLSIVATVPPPGVETEIIESQFIRVGVPIGAASPVTIPYAVTDGSADPVYSAVVVVIMDGASDDQPPVAVGDFVEARPGVPTTLDVLVNDVDPEGLPLTLVSVAEPTDGTAEVVGNRIRLVADDIASGFTFAYEVADEGGNQASAAVSVRIIPAREPNRAPEAIADTARSFGGSPVQIDVMANDRDPDGDAVVLAGHGQPRRGSVVRGTGGLLVYTPDPGFVGTDTFSYEIADAFGDRATGHVTMGAVGGDRLNNPPTANDDTVVVLPGRRQIMIPVLVNDSDPDGDILQVTAVDGATLGSVRIAPRGVGLIYAAPEVSESVEIYLRYSISDGRGGVAGARATVVVDPEAEPQGPVAVDDIVGPVKPGSVEVVDVLANDYDPDGDLGRLELVSISGDATVTADGTVSITAPGESARLSYVVRDQDGDTATGYVSVVVVDNLPPQIAPVAISTPYDTAVEIDLSRFVSDPDRDRVFVVCCGNERGGRTERAADDGVIIYTPSPGFTGQGGISFHADDGHGNIATATALVTVVGENTPPVLREGLGMDVLAGGSLSLHVDDIAVDEDVTDILRIAGVRGGTASIHVSATGDLVTVAADSDALGERATVSVTVTDGEDTVEGEIPVVVTEVQSPPPRAYDDRVAEPLVQEQSVVIDVLANDDDPLGEGLDIVNVSVTPAGTTEIIDGAGSVRFTAATGFVGTARFSYTISDATEEESRRSSAWVEVPVVGVPDAPAPPGVEARSGEVTITWVQPSANGASIDGYRVTRNDGETIEVRNTTSTIWRGLENGRPYSFTIEARNAAGWGVSSGPSQEVVPNELPGIPGAPTLVTGDGRITVSWEPPPNQGSEITLYHLRMYDGVRGIATTTTSTSLLWDDLENGRTYTFSVAAQNLAGITRYGDSSSDFPAGPPTAPAIGDNVTPRDGRVEVGWVEPDWNGHVTNSYVLKILPSGGEFEVSGRTDWVWPDLVNGEEVRFQVRARNKAGEGAWSAPSTRVVPSGPPAPPASVAAGRGDGEATVTWESPDANGARIERYEIQAVSGGAVVATEWADGEASKDSRGVPRSLVFPGLTNGTQYTFRIRAHNIRDISPFSATSNAVVPAGPPFAPTILFAGSFDPVRVDIHWSAPADNGSPITLYELSVNGGTWRPMNASTSYSTAMFDEGTTYGVRVRAVNSVGAGPPSSSVTFATWGPPSAVGKPSVTPGNGEVTVSWSPPFDGGPRINQYVVDISESIGEPVDGPTANSVTWIGLTNGTAYRFRVTAFNGMGASPPGAWSDWVTPVAPPRSITVGKGGSAQGQPDCDSPACAYVTVSAANFAPNTTYLVECWSNEDGGWSRYDSYQRSTNASGSMGSHSVCYYGFPGSHVRIRIDGVDSATYRW